jgi:hypothetical protein
LLWPRTSVWEFGKIKARRGVTARIGLASPKRRRRSRRPRLKSGTGRAQQQKAAGSRRGNREMRLIANYCIVGALALSVMFVSAKMFFI